MAAIEQVLENTAAENRERERERQPQATKEHPWVNSLGMKFVPVAGTQVLFSVWDTRLQDFEAFVAHTNYDATGGMMSLGKDGWKGTGRNKSCVVHIGTKCVEVEWGSDGSNKCLKKRHLQRIDRTPENFP